MNNNFNDIQFILGTYVDKKGIASITWGGNNGILIAGQSGSGKSQTASFILTQMAYYGVQLVLCDYDAPLEEEEALSERCSHLEGAFYLPPVRKDKDIRDYIRKMNEEYNLRIQDPNRRFPLIFVIDEASSFLANEKDNDPNAIHKFVQDQLKIRKVNMRTMLAGQEWSSKFSTQLMRPLRSAFRTKLIHNLDSANSKMVLDSPTNEYIRRAGNLPTGYILYGEDTIKVPKLTEDFKQKTQKAIASYNHNNITNYDRNMENHTHSNVENTAYNWSDEESELYMRALYKYHKNRKVFIPMETREDLIRALIASGKDKEWILKNVKGQRNELVAIISRNTWLSNGRDKHK